MRFSRSTDLPQHWFAHVHPNWQLYFCRQGVPRVVTEAYLYRPEIMDRVTLWVEKIEAMLVDRNLPMNEQMELFVKIEGEDCAYYFVDHATRTQFWLEELNTFDLGLPPVVSPTQLSQQHFIMALAFCSSYSRRHLRRTIPEPRQALPDALWWHCKKLREFLPGSLQTYTPRYIFNESPIALLFYFNFSRARDILCLDFPPFRTRARGVSKPCGEFSRFVPACLRLIDQFKVSDTRSRRI